MIRTAVLPQSTWRDERRISQVLTKLSTTQTDRDLLIVVDHPVSVYLEIVEIQPIKYVLGHAGRAAPTRQTWSRPRRSYKPEGSVCS